MNSIGNPGYGENKVVYTPFKLPEYTQTYTGDSGSVFFSGSIYAAKGWKVEINSGNPYTMVATIGVPLDTDGITPLTGTGSYISVNWSTRFDYTDVDIVHASVNNVSWIYEVNDQDKQQLDFLIANPPTASTAIDWTPGHLFSSNLVSITASQTVWYLYNNGTMKVPVAYPTFHMTADVPSTFDMTPFGTYTLASNPTNCLWSKATLATYLSIPTNWQNDMPNLSDPPTSSTHGIPYHYAYMKMPANKNQFGSRTTAEQDYRYGLWPQNLYGVPL